MKLFLFLLLVSGVQAQQPTFIVAGKMTCAARVNNSVQLQVWCTVGTEIRFNSVFPSPQNVPNVGASGIEVDYADKTVNETYASISWSFFASLTQPGKVDWQAAYTNSNVVSKLMTGTL